MNFPQFGRVRRADFHLAEGIGHLNHGSFGATPRVVLEAANACRLQMEADGTAFFRDALPGLIRGAAERVAGFLGGRTEDWAFVENATQGLNAIIASLRLEPGDELLCLSQTYGAIANTLRYHAERAGARVVSVPVPVPFTDPEPLLAGIAAAIGSRTRLALFDHITSAGAVVLPVREIAALCGARGVAVAIDGAHAPGQLPLDVPAIGVDWYVGNLHKWAPSRQRVRRCCGAPPSGSPRCIRWRSRTISARASQRSSTTAVRATTRRGSRCRPRSITWRRSIRTRCAKHNNALAREAGEMLRDSWGSQIAAAPAYRAAMASVRLPGTRGVDRATARTVGRRLTEEHGITVNVMTLDDSLWARVSAQIYNEIDDYRLLAEIAPRVLRELGV